MRLRDPVGAALQVIMDARASGVPAVLLIQEGAFLRILRLFMI